MARAEVVRRAQISVAWPSALMDLAPQIRLSKKVNLAIFSTEAGTKLVPDTRPPASSSLECFFPFFKVESCHSVHLGPPSWSPRILK